MTYNPPPFLRDQEDAAAAENYRQMLEFAESGLEPQEQHGPIYEALEAAYWRACFKAKERHEAVTPPERWALGRGWWTVCKHLHRTALQPMHWNPDHPNRLLCTACWQKTYDVAYCWRCEGRSGADLTYLTFSLEDDLVTLHCAFCDDCGYPDFKEDQ
jgi:hypothetical protein